MAQACDAGDLIPDRLQMREAEKGFGDEIPKRVWAAAQRTPPRSDQKKGSQEAKRYLTGNHFQTDESTEGVFSSRISANCITGARQRLLPRAFQFCEALAFFAGFLYNIDKAHLRRSGAAALPCAKAPDEWRK
ncbi:MAG: hypothetical protein ACI4MP_11850 [Candidatus Ventricola sp.]